MQLLVTGYNLQDGSKSVSKVLIEQVRTKIGTNKRHFIFNVKL